MAHDVFISCTAADKPVGDAICATLEANNIRCWIAPRNILPGADYATSIVAAIQNSRVLVLVFSSEANVSEHVKREVERAVHQALPIIPVRIEDVMPEGALEYFLSTPQWLDAFVGELKEHFVKLVRVVRVLLGQNLDVPPVVAPVLPETREKSASPLTQSATQLSPNGIAGVLVQSTRTKSKGCIGVSLTFAVTISLGLLLFVGRHDTQSATAPAAENPETISSTASPESSATPMPAGANSSSFLNEDDFESIAGLTKHSTVSDAVRRWGPYKFSSRERNRMTYGWTDARSGREWLTFSIFDPRSYHYGKTWLVSSVKVTCGGALKLDTADPARRLCEASKQDRIRLVRGFGNSDVSACLPVLCPKTDDVHVLMRASDVWVGWFSPL